MFHQGMFSRTSGDRRMNFMRISCGCRTTNMQENDDNTPIITLQGDSATIVMMMLINKFETKFDTSFKIDVASYVRVILSGPLRQSKTFYNMNMIS